MSTFSRRMPLIDALKAVASQLIVLHHLAFYGPMSDVAYPLMSDGIDWLYEYGRMAVQVFLVIAGFLAARSLAPAVTPQVAHPFQLIWSRYRRLALPLFCALFASMLAAAVARHWICYVSIPDAPTLTQLLSHAFLLQNVLEQDALSAGVWYVAIDLQLFAMLALLLWIAGRLGKSSTGMALLFVCCAVFASLFYFNRDDSWDDWAIYFFGSYGLGVLTHWCSQRKYALLWFGLMAFMVGCSLVLEFRPRIAIALGTALALGISQHFNLQEKMPEFRLTAWLGRISYSIFLIHYPVCVLVNTIIFRFAPNSARINLLGMFLAWILSIAAGHFFYQYIESRLGAARRKQAARQTHQPDIQPVAHEF